MKPIHMPTSEGFNIKDNTKLRDLYGVTVYKELSNKIRDITRVCRNGLDSCESHMRFEMAGGGMGNE